MMTDNELDDLFKNTLGNHEAPIPADMWQRIQPGGAKKRAVVLWWKWYAAAAVFLIAGMATWWYADTTPANKNVATAYSKSDKKDNIQQTLPTNGAKDNLPGNSSLQSNTSAQHSTGTNESIASNKNTVLSQAAGEREGNHRISSLNAGTPDEKNTADLKATLSNQQQSITSNNTNNLTDNNIDNNTPNIAQAQSSSSPSAAKSDNKPAGVSNGIPKDDATLNSTNSAAASNNNKKAKLPWTIELFASAAYANKQTYNVKKQNTIGMAAPIQLPQPKPALRNYGAGIRLGIPINRNLSLKTGLQFDQTRQKANYQQQNIVDMIAINGFADTSRFRQIIYESENQQSTYNSISIPVLIAYQTGKKIQLGATAGVIVNAYSWYIGKVPNGSYTATLDAKDTYKHNTGPALYAGITVAKKLGAIEVFAEPHLQYSLSSFTKPDVPFKQKINTYGLSIGIRTPLHK